MNKKELVIRLKHYHSFWYDLLEDKNAVAEYFDTKDLIKKKLIEIEKKLEKNSKFVYFICSREKIRFDITKKPRYKCFSSSTVYIPIIMGNKRKTISVFLPEFKDASKENRPKVETTAKYITFSFCNGNKKTIPIHKFIEDSKIILEHSNKVEYIGYTKNPSSRPTNGAHAGLSTILYNLMTSNKNRDIIIYFNEFSYYLDDCPFETNLNIEEKIIEKSFILYFDSISQDKNRENEEKELINSLKKLEEEKIHSISFDYEFAVTNGYSNFSSDKVLDSHVHNFSIYLNQNKIMIDKNQPSKSKYGDVKTNTNIDWTAHKILDE